jgi:hypothetical protein
MKWTAMSLALLAAACAGQSWVDIPVVSDLSPARPCQSSVAAIWTDSLPLIADTSQQHLVAGGGAINFPAELKLEHRSGLVRARFAIDTVGRVIPGSGIIEASSDEQFARAVCYGIPNLKYEPVVLAGRKAVVGLVHVPFTFEVR